VSFGDFERKLGRELLEEGDIRNLGIGLGHPFVSQDIRFWDSEECSKLDLD
jgi:hypothetical protein